jgi:puromycin-sensitive aminopeptidase
VGTGGTDGSLSPMPPTDDTAALDQAYRLPRDAEPHLYRLTLAPDLGAATFTGSVEIDLTVHRPVRRLVCNAAELAIEEATLHPAGGPTVPASVALDEEAERATFSFDTEVPPGKATLHCTFAGTLNDKLRGFYRSTYEDEEGVTRTIAATQMESTDARRAFPCWDEPDRKAVFDVTLVVDPDLAAFSNSSVVEEAVVPAGQPGAGQRAVHFAPTMKMSTYLVAFVVGPLEATDPLDVDGVPVRVVHVPGKARLTPFALEVAAHSLRFFTDYFAIPYPADKLDLVAIPDFAFGAMENLGCVTFRETALLVDPASAARTELERVADVIAHEIAHMWFGDLVTMRWWEGIWLNEAFATFMEVLCVDAFRPAWQRWVSFGLEREAALAVDGLHATRPIEYPVGSPEEADGMFDVLTYQKGGSVLRMLERYLGAEVFRDGVRLYLRTHAYDNTVTGDLWDALEEVSGQPVRATMDSWILQGGHPLVTAAEGTLTQSPFSYTPLTPGQENAIGRQWQVPVLLRQLSGDRTERLLLGEAPAPVPPGSVVNAGGWGVYRVAYGDLSGLARRLPDLDSLERCNLFADTWALVLAGRADLGGFLSLAGGLGDEDEPGIFTVVAGALGLCDRVAAEGDRGAVEDATQALLGPRAADLGWEHRPGEGERVPTLRALLLAALGTVGADPGVQAEAARRFDRSGTTPIDPDIEGAVLHSVAAQLRPGDYEAVLDRYHHPANPQEELRYLTALAAFPDVELARRTFELARTEVRSQNAPYLVATLLGNRVGGPAVWQRVKEEWDALLDRFPVNSHSRMLDGARSLCGDPAVAEDVARFLEEHPLRSGQRSVTQTVERLRVNVAFGQRHRTELAATLAAATAADGP